MANKHTKTCPDCGQQFTRGVRSFRCESCQTAVTKMKHYQAQRIRKQSVGTITKGEDDPLGPVTLDMHLTHRAFFDLLRRPVKKNRACLRCRQMILGYARLCANCVNVTRKSGALAQ